MSARTWIARRLRYVADRIDPSTGPRAIGAHFNIVEGVGLVITQTFGIPVNPRALGCPLWFMQEDYDRAFTDYTRQETPKNGTYRPFGQGLPLAPSYRLPRKWL